MGVISAVVDLVQYAIPLTTTTTTLGYPFPPFGALVRVVRVWGLGLLGWCRLCVNLRGYVVARPCVQQV